MEGVIDDDGVKMMDVTQLMMSVTETWSQFDVTLSAHLLLRPGRGRCIASSLSVCVFLCASVCLSLSVSACLSVSEHIYGTTGPKFCV